MIEFKKQLLGCFGSGIGTRTPITWTRTKRPTIRRSPNDFNILYSAIIDVKCQNKNPTCRPGFSCLGVFWINAFSNIFDLPWFLVFFKRPPLIKDLAKNMNRAVGFQDLKICLNSVFNYIKRLLRFVFKNNCYRCIKLKQPHRYILLYDTMFICLLF